MEFVIDFLYVKDGDAIIIWGRDPQIKDYIFFLDGGNEGNGRAIVDHYQKWIKPHLYKEHIIAFINSHPHRDHINGLIEVVAELGNDINYGIYNDPVEFISNELREKIKKSALNKEDDDIVHLYKSFQKVQELNDLCKKFNIEKIEALSDQFNYNNIKIVSPTRKYYKEKVQQFTNIDFLKQVSYAKSYTEISDEDESLKPCVVVDEKNDASPENLSATVIQLVDSKGNKYLLTSDAGVESFEEMESNGYNCNNHVFVQLPHHGSRRNVSTKWIAKFNPQFYIASAEGNKKHPRKAVISCIRKNLPNCKIYSTSKKKNTISYTTDKSIFPNRYWGPAEEL